MKVIFNYATRQFESMEPTMRERFALGGGVIQGEKVGGRENFAKVQRMPAYKTLPIDLLPVDNSKLFSGSGTKTSILTPNGQNLLTNVKNMIKYYNDNSIPVPSNGDIFSAASGGSFSKEKYRGAGGSSSLTKVFGEEFKKLVPTTTKIDNYVNRFVLNPNTDWREVAYVSKHLQNKFGVSESFITRNTNNGKISSLADVDNKPLFNMLNNPKFVARQRDGTRFKTISDVMDYTDVRVPTTVLAANRRTPGYIIMDFALKHAIKADRSGQSSVVKFIGEGNPLYLDAKDLKFYYNGKTYQLNPDMEFLTPREMRGLPESARKINALQIQSGQELKLLKSQFPEVYKVLDDLETYKNTKVGDKTLTRIAQEKKYDADPRPTKQKKSIMFKPDVEIDHIDGIEKRPFTNLRLLDADINRQAGNLKSQFLSNQIDEATYKNSLEKIGYNKKYKDVDEFINNRKIDLQVDVPNLKQSPSKIKTALKAAKPVLKALPIIGTGIGLYDVNKALQAGITDPRDLVAAYNVSAEVAAKQKAIREDPTGKLGQQEITNLPDIGQELPDSDEVAGLLEESGSPYMQFLQGGGQLTPEEFNQLQSIPQSDRPLTGELDLPEMDQTMMAAQGGRVGFKDGSPNPMEEMATLRQAIAAVRSPEVTDQFLYDTSPVGKLEKNLLGKDGDRTLMQSFNTQFLDPRAYPYYGQRLLRGAANIPEFILSTPKAGLAFIQDLRQNAGITKEGVEEILEILDPSITRDFLNGEFGDLLGISDKAIQASEEKRTGPQRTTGEFLQVAGELPGPATPIFLLGYAPKLLKQLGSLGASGNAIDKINKEIENKVAQQGVDQTRRDIVLSIGAGGAVAFLKYLGLDFLSKAPKVVEKVAPTVTKGGTPKYFFDFVSLIKSKGDDITEKAATLERQKVYDYNGYTMYEDISTGKISIRKDTEGGATYSIGDGEYETVEGIVRKEEINYDPPETILDDKGKPKEVPDSYEEATLKPDAEGDLDDVDQGLDSIDEILELLAKDGKTYSKEELTEMGLNTGSSNIIRFMKDKKAGGGIVKLAGADSGPPPKSGPTPHGLPYVAKNVRPIKERK